MSAKIYNFELSGGINLYIDGALVETYSPKSKVKIKVNNGILSVIPIPISSISERTEFYIKDAGENSNNTFQINGVTESGGFDVYAKRLTAEVFLDEGSGSTTLGLIGTTTGNDSTDELVIQGARLGADTDDSKTFFGYEAGLNDVQIRTTSIGYSSGKNNVKPELTSYGYNAALENNGENNTSIGANSSLNNTGNDVTSIGNQSCANNIGENVIGIGVGAASNNDGTNCIFIGNTVGTNNTGSNIIAIGTGLLNNPPNSYNDIILFGNDAVPTSNNQTIFGNSNNPIIINHAGISVSSAGTLTLAYGGDYVATGTTATYTLPAIDAAIKGRWMSIIIKNRQSGVLTINSSGGGNDIFTTSAVNTLALAVGESVTLMPDGEKLNLV